MSQEIDHESTDEITCPHCGYADPDSWEIAGGENQDDESGETSCARCDKAFYWSQHVRVTYTTKIKEAQP